MSSGSSVSDRQWPQYPYSRYESATNGGNRDVVACCVGGLTPGLAQGRAGLDLSRCASGNKGYLTPPRRRDAQLSPLAAILGRVSESLALSVCCIEPGEFTMRRARHRIAYEALGVVAEAITVLCEPRLACALVQFLLTSTGAKLKGRA